MESHFSDISPILLKEADVEDCLRLSVGAGWNQTTEDWHFHVEVGSGVGLRAGDGSLIATGVTLPAADDTGWIAMVLVDGSWRRRGLGRNIMKMMICGAPSRHFALDATEFGLGLYESLGFQALEEIVRYRSRREGDPSFASQHEEAPEDPRLNAIAARLAKRADVVSRISDSAYALLRSGRTAIHLGPLIAGREVDAETLVKSVLNESDGDVLIDAPARCGSFCRRLERLGFEASRSFVRMSLGRPFLVEPGTFAIGGPEYG